MTTFVGFEESEAEFVPMALEEWSGSGHVSLERIAEREHWAAQELKRCTRCGQTKSLEHFHHSKKAYDGHRPECGKCQSKREKLSRKTARGQLARHGNDRGAILKWKQGRQCISCGESHPACIEFHHRDPTTKLFEISEKGRRSIPDAEIEAEIAKCDVLCANCHAKLHWEETDAKYAKLEELDSHRMRQFLMVGT